MFVFAQPRMVVKSQPLSNCRSCEKAAFKELQRSYDCILMAGEGAAFYFRFRKAAFLFVCAGRDKNLTKKVKFFSKKLR